MPKTKTFPDTTLADALRDKGLRVSCLWQVKGPPKTTIAWMEGYLVEAEVVIVSTFKPHQGRTGWQAYINTKNPMVEGTIEEVVAACTPQREPPDLLAALKFCTEELTLLKNKTGHFGASLPAAIAAIAKAEGRA